MTAMRLNPLTITIAPNFWLWSTEDPEYKGENAEIEAIIDSIRAEVGNRGIYVYDRGGDRNEIFRYFISCGLDFIVRLM